MEPRGFGSTLIGTVGIAVLGAILTLFFVLVVESPITCENDWGLGTIVATGGLVVTALAIGLW
jgi:hypothetical protein